jgi:hypothetical protein
MLGLCIRLAFQRGKGCLSLSEYGLCSLCPCYTWYAQSIYWLKNDTNVVKMLTLLMNCDILCFIHQPIQVELLCPAGGDGGEEDVGPLPPADFDPDAEGGEDDMVGPVPPKAKKRKVCTGRMSIGHQHEDAACDCTSSPMVAD